MSVEFGDRVDPLFAARVLALDAALRSDPLPGLLETLPTYRALLVHYDPLRLEHADLVAHLRRALRTPQPEAGTGRLWRLPACYDPAVAEDLAHVAAVTGVEPQEVARLHAQTVFTLAMYGFAPGWAYLAGLPEVLGLPRRATPRDRIPAGSLIIAGGLAIVSAQPMPSGWHILGRTPERLFAPDRRPAFLFAPGDRLTFSPVDVATLAALEARAAAGEVLARIVAP